MIGQELPNVLPLYLTDMITQIFCESVLLAYEYELADCIELARADVEQAVMVAVARIEEQRVRMY